MTEQELLEAIRQAHVITSDEQAMTTEEICQATGMGVKAVRARLKKLVGEGKMSVTWVMRDTLTTPLTGRQARVPGYRAHGA